MTKYKVEYTYQGTGTCTVEASSEEEAQDAFYDGAFSDDVDVPTGYDFESATLTK